MNRRKFIKASGSILGASSVQLEQVEAKSNKGDSYISELELSEKLIDERKERGVVSVDGVVNRIENRDSIKQIEVMIRFEDCENNQIMTLQEASDCPEIIENRWKFNQVFFAESSRIERINQVVASLKIHRE